jgi:hypothetical protein
MQFHFSLHPTALLLHFYCTLLHVQDLFIPNSIISKSKKVEALHDCRPFALGAWGTIRVRTGWGVVGVRGVGGMGGEGLMTIQLEWLAGFGVVVLVHVEIGCVGPTAAGLSSAALALSGARGTKAVHQ